MLKKEVVRLLNSIGIKAELNDLEKPEKPEFGDLSYPCFKLAKEQNKNPNELAKEIVRKIPVSKHPLILKVEARGGYVNFFFYWEKLAERILKPIIEQKKTGFW